jgi:hypothetical protein
MPTDETFEDDNCTDCADEGMVFDGPGTFFRALIEVEPAQPAFKSALWRGLAGGGALYHRADTLAGLTPQAY